MKFARGTKAAHYGALTKAEGASASGNEEEVRKDQGNLWLIDRQ